MKNLLKQLNQKPIAYYPIYRELTGTTTAGILLSQLMYWFSKQDKFYKTNDELIEETYLTLNELKTAKKNIKKLDFIEVTIEGVPAKTFYKINWDKYQTSMSESNHLVGGNPTNCMDGIQPTITENTHKTTTDIKNKQKEIYPENLNIEAFNSWCEYKGKSYSNQGKSLSINKLIQYPKEVQQQMVDSSIMNNYKGLFEIKKQPGQNKNTFAIKDIDYSDDEKGSF